MQDVCSLGQCVVVPSIVTLAGVEDPGFTGDLPLAKMGRPGIVLYSSPLLATYRLCATIMLDLRGHSGCVIRWGEGWFEVVRDGVGWEFQRHDREKISERVFPLRIFPWRRERSLLAIVDAVLAIE